MAALSPARERLLLQIAVAVGGFVPVAVGIFGAIVGVGLTDEGVLAVSLDSQMRFLSGLLLAIGLAYWEAIPQIERRGQRIRLLTLIVVLGGLVRLIGILFVALPGLPMLASLALELVAAPLVGLWQARVATRFAVRS